MEAAVCHPARVPSVPSCAWNQDTLCSFTCNQKFKSSWSAMDWPSVIEAKLSELTILIKNNVMISSITKRIARAILSIKCAVVGSVLEKFSCMCICFGNDFETKDSQECPWIERKMPEFGLWCRIFGCKSSILSLVSSSSLCLCASNMFWEVNFSLHGGGALLRAQHDYHGEGRRLPVHHVQLKVCVEWGCPSLDCKYMSDLHSIECCKSLFIFTTKCFYVGACG